MNFKSPTYNHLNFMAKKRDLSGLSGADLVLAIEAIERLRRSMIYEEADTEEEGETGDLRGRLANVLLLLKARAEPRQELQICTPPFSPKLS